MPTSAVVDRPAPSKAKPGRDKDHYIYPPTGKLFTRVSTILSATESEAYLADWYAVRGAMFAVDHMLEIAAMIAAGKRDDAVALIAGQAPQITRLKADTGTYVHDVVEQLIIYQSMRGRTGAMLTLPELPGHLRGEEYDGIPLELVADEMTAGFLQFVGDWNPEFLAAEMTVYNPGLRVAGTLDMIIRLRDVAVSADGTGLVHAPGKTLILCVDTKTGRYYKKRWRCQLAAYRRMKQARMPMGDLAPMLRTDAAAILHLRHSYKRGYRLMLVSGTAEAAAWNEFNRRCQVYFTRQGQPEKPGMVIYPPGPGGVMPSPLVADLDGEGFGRAISPLVKEFGDDVTLADVASFTEAEILKVKGIGEKTAVLAAAMLASRRLSFAGSGTGLPPGKAA